VAGSEGAAVYARGIDGSPAVRLGQGLALDVSADGRLVAALGHTRGQPSHELVLIPMGPGETRTLPEHGLEYRDARFLTADKLLAVARQPKADWRLWRVRESQADPQPLTPEGFGAGVPGPDGGGLGGPPGEGGALFLARGLR
jgi:hypothetical protein